MAYTREIYWNIGHGAAVLVPLYLLTFTAVALLALGFWRRIKVYRQGRVLGRTDGLADRALVALKQVLSQKKVLRVPGAGTAHGLFFWSFFLLFAGTCLIVVQADFSDPLFGIRFLKGHFYLLFSLVLDLAGLGALFMLGGLFVRRYLLRPQGLVTKGDHALMHALLFTILLTGFMIEGTRMAATELGMELAVWSPVGLLVAKMFAPFGVEGLHNVHRCLWWFHLLISLGFIALVPFTLFRHIFTTSANYLFADRGPRGALVPLSFEEGTAQHYGASKVSDLTWKDLLDADACTECKRCQDRCPAHLTDKPLSPMKLVNELQEAAFNAPAESLVDKVGEDALWSCTTCRACTESCPAAVEHLPKIVEMRRHAVLSESRFPQEYKQLFKDMETFGDSVGKGSSFREEWASRLKIKRTGQDEPVDFLFWAGCQGALYDERSRNTLVATARVLEKAGLNFGILGREERCCGDLARRMGNEYLFQRLARQNIETLQRHGIKRIVTNCPHCFTALRDHYPQFGATFEVMHSVELVERLIGEGKLAVQAKIDATFTYHDPCYLGRYNELYPEPRKILDHILRTGLKEMERSKGNSFCCGAGGGNIWRGGSVGQRIEEVRVEEAVQTGADGIVTSCPFCEIMIDSGVKQKGMEYTFRVADLMELVDQAT